MFILEDPISKNQIVKILINTCCDGTLASTQYALPITNFTNIISASFIDYLENGIIDFFICTT